MSHHNLLDHYIRYNYKTQTLGAREGFKTLNEILSLSLRPRHRNENVTFSESLHTLRICSEYTGAASKKNEAMETVLKIKDRAKKLKKNDPT